MNPRDRAVRAPAPVTDDRSDADLLAAHVDGDRAAFGVLVTRHRDRLWAVALRTAGDPETAADALQDAMISAFRRAGSFRGDAAVTTWLHRIVVNAALDRLRRAGVRRADPLPDDLGTAALPGDLPGRSGGSRLDDPERSLLDHELRDRVHDALRALPEDQRVCLVLVDLEEWSVADAAAHLGIPTGTVKSRCHRGRARLAALLPDLRPTPTESDPAAGAPGTVASRGASDPTDAPTGTRPGIGRNSSGGGRA